MASRSGDQDAGRFGVVGALKAHEGEVTVCRFEELAGPGDHLAGGDYLPVWLEREGGGAGTVAAKSLRRQRLDEGLVRRPVGPVAG
jgi:hypothetical protein